MGVCVTKPIVSREAFTVALDKSLGSNSSVKESNGSRCEEDPIHPLINVDPPLGFHPNILVSEEEEHCRKTIQNMKKPNTRNNLMTSWEESGFLSVIHNHVASISSANLVTFRDLARALTCDTAKYVRQLSESFDRAVAKAYSIYFWIASNVHYDVEKSFDGSLLDINTRKASSGGYASLFNALCTEVGLKAQKVGGNLRRWRSLAGQFSPEECNYHSWNVVIIEDRPLLIDCTLGSGYVTSSFQFIKLYSRHYFITAPENLILTHWPRDSSKQFLWQPLSLEDLQPIIPISAEMLSRGLSPSNWSEVIQVPQDSADPVASVVLSLGTMSSHYVTANLVAQSKDEVESLENHTFVSQVGSGEFSVQAVLPTSGNFILNIYLNDVRESHVKNISLSYIIECKISHDIKVGYPSIFPLPARAFNFTPKYWNDKVSYCCSSSAQLSMVFEASPDIAFDHCLTRGRKTGPGESLENDIYRQQTLLQNNMNRYKLLAIFPATGWWTICIAGTKTGVGVVSGYTSVLTYHVYAEESSMKMSYPQILMPGIVFVPRKPVETSESALTTVPFVTQKPLDFHHYLTRHSDNKMLNGYSNIELASKNNGHVKYALNLLFPSTGEWYVHVYSTQCNGEDKQIFKLKLNASCATPNTFLIESNALLLKEYEISVLNNGMVTFPDDGKPFSLEFKHASDDLDFIHELKSPQDSPVDYCSYLSHQVTAPCTLSAVFPTPGRWTLQLFARKDGTDETYGLVLQIQLDVKVPAPEYRYPKVYPAFGELGCRILAGDALLKSSCSGEFKMLFQAASKLYFFFKVESESGDDFSQQAYVHTSPNSENKTIHLVFQGNGRWTVHMYAEPSQKHIEGKNAAEILQISLENEKCTRNASFPLLLRGAFIEPFDLYFDPEDLPLPLVLQAVNPPQRLTINYYSSLDIQFTHYAEVRNGEADDKVTEHVQTRMMSSDSGLHQLQVEVTKVGQWTVLLYASDADTTESTDKWTPMMQYKFSAVTQSP